MLLMFFYFRNRQIKLKTKKKKKKNKNSFAWLSNSISLGKRAIEHANQNKHFSKMKVNSQYAQIRAQKSKCK